MSEIRTGKEEILTEEINRNTQLESRYFGSHILKATKFPKRRMSHVALPPQ